MAGVFGQASASLGKSWEFGSGSNSSNRFASNTLGTTSSPFPSLPTQQRSGFGGTATNVFGAPSSSSTLSSSLAFTFGQPSSLLGSSSMFGTTSTGSLSSLGSTSNFGVGSFPSLQTQGSVFGGTTSNLFGAQSSSSIVSSPSFTFGQPASSFGSTSMLGTTSTRSHGSLGSTTSRGAFGGPSSSLPIFGNTTSAGQNSFATHTTESAATPSFPTQRSLLGGTSIGLSGASSSSFFTSPTTFKFGDGPAGASGSSTVFGPDNNKSDSAVPYMPIRGVLASQTTGSNFGGTSNALGTTPVYPISISSPAASSSLPAGSRIKNYAHTITKDDKGSWNMISIAAMPFYENKSHEELRWEDYELKSGGQKNSASIEVQGINRQQSFFRFPSVTSSLNPITPPSIAPGFSTNMNTSTFPSLAFPSVTSSLNTATPPSIAPASSTKMNTSTFPIFAFPSVTSSLNTVTPPSIAAASSTNMNTSTFPSFPFPLVTSSLNTLTPPCIPSASSTNMNTSTFPSSFLSSPGSSPFYSQSHIQTPTSNSSTLFTSVLPQGPIVPSAVAPRFCSDNQPLNKPQLPTQPIYTAFQEAKPSTYIGNLMTHMIVSNAPYLAKTFAPAFVH